MENNFDNYKYTVVKDAVSKDIANFVKEYFLLKRKVVGHLFSHKIISPFSDEWGTFGDAQVPDTYAHYSDLAMEVLLKGLKVTMEKITNKKLVENYSYARIYKYGDTLQRHTDRAACEISTTLNLGGDPWPIYLDPTGGTGNEGIEINLRPGDMLIYKGAEVEHWRYPFIGNQCIQVFLHYNNVETLNSEKDKYDTREFLGLPSKFKNPNND